VSGGEVENSTNNQGCPSGTEKHGGPGDGGFQSLAGFLDYRGMNDLAKAAADGAELALDAG